MFRRGSPLLAAALLALALAAPPAAADDPGAAAEPAPLLEGVDLVASVLALADERLALMPAVAAAKWRSGQPIADPARETAVIDAAQAHAARVGLDPEAVGAFFAVQIRLARRSQEALHAQWRAAGGDGAGPAPAAIAELRPRLDHLSGALIDALYLAAPELGGDGAAARAAGLARERLPAPRWSDDARTELLAALGRIRYAAPPSPDRARAAGVLRIGTPADYAPFSVATAAGVSGVDVELAQRLAAALGLRPVFVHSAWKTLLGDLAADRFDVAVGGISVTAARRAVAAFSLPVAHGGKTAVGRCADRERYASWDAIDQAGVRVVENPGGTNEQFARTALHRAGIALHPDNRTVFGELLSGRADVMFTDDTEIALAVRRYPQLCRLLPQLYQPADKAFLLPPQPAWRSAVDGWLQPELAAGVPARLLEAYLRR